MTYDTNMLHLITTFKGAAAISGICMAGITGGILADVISNDTPITLGGAIAVTATIVGGAWYLSSRLTKIDDRLDNIEKHVSTLLCGENGEDCPKKKKNGGKSV